jgi:hypothetical protein
MKFLKIFLILIFLLVISCEKEGIYFDEYRYGIEDSTIYVIYYYVYCENKIVYKEKVDKIYKFYQLKELKDSLEELHKEKFDWFYIETK